MSLVFGAGDIVKTDNWDKSIYIYIYTCNNEI